MATTSTKTKAKTTTKKEEIQQPQIDMEALIAQITKSVTAEVEKKYEQKLKEKLVQAEATMIVEEEKKELTKEIKVREKVNMSKEVEVKSVCVGTLTVRTKVQDYNFSGYGDIQEITIGELKALRSSSPAYFTTPMFVIEDEEASRICNITDMYEKVIQLDDIESFVKQPVDIIISNLKEVPVFIRQTVASKAMELYEAKKLTDLVVIEAIEDLSGYRILAKR